jgi:hypothetical protein
LYSARFRRKGKIYYSLIHDILNISFYKICQKTPGF